MPHDNGMWVHVDTTFVKNNQGPNYSAFNFIEEVNQWNILGFDGWSSQDMSKVGMPSTLQK